jgi:aspartokinase/homoserine dehydrogenase 1
MQVLKFGGTSVASAENIQKVIAIVTSALDEGPVVLVVSALGGTTDALINAGQAAARGDESFRQALSQLEARHLTAAELLLPSFEAQAEIQPWLTAQFTKLALLADGIFALGELSPRTLDRLMSYGELLSSRLVVAALQAQGIATAWADSRQLIRTNSRFGTAQVDEATTGDAGFSGPKPRKPVGRARLYCRRCRGPHHHAGPRRLRLHGGDFGGRAGGRKARNLDRRERHAHR